MSAAILNIGSAFYAIAGKRKYHPSLQMLRGQRVSGIYAIMDRRLFLEGRRGEVLYVGESHTDRLYDTITRHFRSWKVDPQNDALGRRRGGTTYDRNKVFLAWAILPKGEAQDAQYAEIQRLKPRDNSIDGCATVDGGECSRD